MATTPGPSSPDAGQAEKAAIMQWMRDVSLEATRPTADEIDKLAGLLPAGARLYLTAAPGRALDELERAAALARARGLTPVPHLSARHFISFDQVDNHLRVLAAGSAAGELMLVGGDIARPKGEVADVLSLIESGLLEKHGVRRVGLAGFPDGHPHMREEELEANLLTKLAALQQRGVEGEIVTQFCFDSGPILRWLEWLRARRSRACACRSRWPHKSSLLAELCAPLRSQGVGGGLGLPQRIDQAGFQAGRARSDHQNPGARAERAGPRQRAAAPFCFRRHRANRPLGARAHAWRDQAHPGWRVRSAMTWIDRSSSMRRLDRCITHAWA